MKLYLLIGAAGLSLSACATQAPAVASKTCATEPVIMVVSGETLDRARMGQYAKAIADAGIYPANQGYYLNAPNPIDVFEGDVSGNHATLMVRFPSLKAARAFWDSDVYQNDIKPLRLNPSAGDYTVTVYKELDLPDYMKEQVSKSEYACP